jgi:(E)-4-hydroxy-3-methylbut-2-enyl-diphosphate synthase
VRFKTREVMVGKLGVGGNNPIRIQSMTTSSTRDVDATVEQALRLYDAGCEIVRVTVQGIKEADACEGIKNGLLKKGLDIPLVADIHFYPPAAMRVVDFVDKVRINPGNFVDKRASFKVIEYDDASYAKELEKIEEKFTPLVEKCKKLKRSMRIGTNHGSLSDRIMNRYGDSPAGMVESALEFTRIARKLDYHDIIFSMKASNTKVMIEAYRKLVAEMIRLGWDYPLHLGVTEAGLGEDGRIKSAVGIGSLLYEGIGDTIRVSLTEDPWCEIDPCKRLIQFAEEKQKVFIVPAAPEKRQVVFPKDVGMHRDGTVLVTVDEGDLQRPDFFRMIGCEVVLGRPKLKATSADQIVLLDLPKDRTSFDVLNRLQEIGIGIISLHLIGGATRLMTLPQALHASQKNDIVEQFQLQKLQNPSYAVMIGQESPEDWDKLLDINVSMIIFTPQSDPVREGRVFFEWLKKHDVETPVILHFRHLLDYDDAVIHAAAEYGSLLTDGLGEGIWIEAPLGLETRCQLSFNILQAARMRSSKTDFISCPSCGRTLFDLQDVTKRIRSRTAHLPGVKIAIMGCIVNGPGEMADADFGYVGSKPGKIDLYVGKECVEKDIDFADADDRLVELIKLHGRWQEA